MFEPKDTNYKAVKILCIFNNHIFRIHIFEFIPHKNELYGTYGKFGTYGTFGTYSTYGSYGTHGTNGAYGTYCMGGPFVEAKERLVRAPQSYL